MSFIATEGSRPEDTAAQSSAEDDAMIRRLFLSVPVLAAMAAAAPAQAQCDTRFDFHNRSGRTVMELYFDRSSNPNWTRDELGTGVLPNGQSRRFTAAYSGLYDFRAVLDNGQALEIRQVDICRITSVTASGGRLVAQ